MKKASKWLLRIGLAALILILALVLFFYFSTKIDTPKHKNTQLPTRISIDSSTFAVEKSWIHKTKYGLYEMYIDAPDAFNRGKINGVLSAELVKKQEAYFVSSIKELIPSENYLRFLKYFIKFFDRNIDKHITAEYLDEIYGVSLSTDSQFDFIAPAYERLLNYHGAHDIGHALQGMNMVVGCSSFGVWGNKCSDSTLLIGRNFDFYVGDSFAKNKIVAFIKPDKGNAFAIITWGGMIGAVSGMNDKGLTLTINASKSDYPSGARTPISILCREILQYASTIEEAYTIAKKREIFVSESILIGSWNDRKAAIIEKSPNQTALYQSNNSSIICSNHFQSDTFKNTKENLENIENSTSMYRFKTMQKCIQDKPSFTYSDIADVLRKRDGINNEDVGMGNEMALNQLIGHHSIIFKPDALQMWVSVGPYQLGEFVCYDLNHIFKGMPASSEHYEESLTITADPFLSSPSYKNLLTFRMYKQKFLQHVIQGTDWKLSEIQEKEFIASNPEYYDTYGILGRYFEGEKQYAKARDYFTICLQKGNCSLAEKTYYQKRIQELATK